MNGIRRPYQRETEDVRREALISAALDLIAVGGIKAATVRAIAEKAGVTSGLIRHYFASKDDLVRESYHWMMQRMIADSADVLKDSECDPITDLAVFVATTLAPPVVDAARLGLWAGFMHEVQHDPLIRQVHIQTYFGYRDVLQSLIGRLPRAVSAEQLRVDAIACNGVIDGLWMEACAVPEIFAPGEIQRIGLTSVGAILGVDQLSAHEASQRPTS